MIPTTLAHELNQFYKTHFPLIRSIEVIGDFESGAGRNLSVIDAFMLSNYAKDISSGAVEYIDYVSRMSDQFRKVEIYFNQQIKIESDHKDAVARPGGWAGHGCLPIALALYTNSRNGIIGNYIECGVFRGGALACISHACDYLGITAFGADTFEGLPASDESGYWNKGQFLGSLDDVTAAINAAGRPESVIYIKGLFNESLKLFKEPVSVVFLDTDLYDSSRSALSVMKNNFSVDTIYFSDGVSGRRDFCKGVFSPAQNEAKAVADYFVSTNSRALSVWTGNGNMGIFKKTRAESSSLIFSTSFVSYLSKRYFFPTRFEDHIYVKGRSDKLGISSGFDVTEELLLDYCASELIQEVIAQNYYIGHLEWKNNHK